MATDPQSLVHGTAVEANSALEKLATALGQAGADQNTISVVNKMANITKQLVHAVGPKAGQDQGAPPEGAPEAQPRTTSEATDQMVAGMRGQ